MTRFLKPSLEARRPSWNLENIECKERSQTWGCLTVIGLVCLGIGCRPLAVGADVWTTLTTLSATDAINAAFCFVVGRRWDANEC